MSNLRFGWYYIPRNNKVGRLFNVVGIKEASVTGKPWYIVKPSIETYGDGALYDAESELNYTIEDKAIPISRIDSAIRHEIIRSVLGKLSKITDKRPI